MAHERAAFDVDGQLGHAPHDGNLFAISGRFVPTTFLHAEHDLLAAYPAGRSAIAAAGTLRSVRRD